MVEALSSGIWCFLALPASTQEPAPPWRSPAATSADDRGLRVLPAPRGLLAALVSLCFPPSPALTVIVSFAQNPLCAVHFQAPATPHPAQQCDLLGHLIWLRVSTLV
jgi:hypothetical protein